MEKKVGLMVDSKAGGSVVLTVAAKVDVKAYIT